MSGSKGHIRSRGDHTSIIDAAIPIIEVLSKAGFADSISPLLIEKVVGRSGQQSQLIILLQESGVQLTIIGNAFKQVVQVYTGKKRQVIMILIAHMGGRKARRTRIHKS